MIPAGTRLGRFQIVSLIGAGGMGEVYRARDESLQRFVALKVLAAGIHAEPARVARFQQEARAASALNHPHILHVYEIGEAKVDGAQQHYIAMELVDGETLRERLGGRSELSRILEWLAQVAEALGKAHTAGIVHRDLKPENIMISSDGYAKVLDFGLAKLLEGSPARSAATPESPTTRMLTSTGAMVGTPAYMSPEQIEGRPVDGRSDIFSLGCILYEAVNGKHPFAADSVIDTMHKIVHEEPTPLKAPPVLDSIVRKCTRKRPEDRYQSASELALDLRAYGRGSTPAGIALPALPRRVVTWTLSVAALALIVAIVVLLVNRQHRADATRPIDTASVKLERLTFSGDLSGARISSDGKYLTFIRDSGSETSVVVRQLDAAADVTLSGPASNKHRSVLFSPDSSYVYFLQADSGEPRLSHLYRVPVIGGQPVRVISDIDSAPTFAPDGRLAFVRWSQSDFGSSCAIMIADSNGEDQRPLATRLRGGFSELAWSPDGRVIAANGRSLMARPQLLMVDAMSGAITSFKNGEFSSPTWLPSGRGILVLRPEGWRRWQVWLADYPLGTERRLTNDTNFYQGLSVTADGQRIITTSVQGSSSIWTMRPGNQGSLRQLTPGRPGRVDGAGICWTREGKLIYGSIAGVAETWIMNHDGSEPRKIAEFPLPKDKPLLRVAPAANPHMDLVAIGRPDRGNACLIDLRDGSVTPLTEHDLDHEFVWSPDGRYLYFLFSSKMPSGFSLVYQSIFVFDTGTKSLNEFRYRDKPVAAFPMGVTADLLYVVGTPQLGGRQTLARIRRDGSSLASLPRPDNFDSEGWLTPDEGNVVYTGRDGNVWLYSIATGASKPLTSFRGERISSFALSRKGELALQRTGVNTIDAVEIQLSSPDRSKK